jgi:hypothetical protein
MGREPLLIFHAAKFAANREKYREVLAFRPVFGKAVEKSQTI